MLNSIVLVSAFVFFVLLSGLFSGSETGLYQLSRVRLRLGIEKKRLPFVMLGKIMRDSPGLLLSTLIGTNLGNYLATSAVTYIFITRVGPEPAELLTTLVTAPVLFVFSELIPKNIFFYRADFLMPCVAPLLFVFHKALTWCGAVGLFRFISGVFSRLVGLTSSSKAVITSAQRHRIRAILQETREEGILSSVQTEIIDRIVSIPSIRIRSIMIPVNKVQTVHVNCDRSGLLKKLAECAFTRLLVYEGQGRHVVGFTDVYEALASSQEFSDLRQFVKPIRRLDEDTAVTDAIHIMQTENHKIVLVTRAGRGGRERPIGVVTMKDLAEELLGELAEW